MEDAGNNLHEKSFSFEQENLQRSLQEVFNTFSKTFFEATRFVSRDWRRLNEEEFAVLQRERENHEDVVRAFCMFFDGLNDEDLKKVAYLTNGKIILENNDTRISLIIEGQKIDLREYADKSKYGHTPEFLRMFQSMDLVINFLRKEGFLSSLFLLERLQGNGEYDKVISLQKLIDNGFNEEFDFEDRSQVKSLYNNFITLSGVNALTDLGKFTLRAVGVGTNEGGIDSVPISDYIINKLIGVINEAGIPPQQVKDAAAIVTYGDLDKVGGRMKILEAYALQVKILTSLYRKGVWI